MVPKGMSQGPPGLVSHKARWAQSNGGELVSPQVGKRRGGRILATGMVKKQRREAVPEEVSPCSHQFLIVFNVDKQKQAEVI